jgi:hypothetical protein
MCGASSSAGEWSTLLEPAQLPDGWPRRVDDPRLGEVVEHNTAGLRGREVIACARRAGASTNVNILDLVEINPRFDQDSPSAR